MRSIKWDIDSDRDGGREIREAAGFLYPPPSQPGPIQPPAQVDDHAAWPEAPDAWPDQHPLAHPWPARDHAALETSTRPKAASGLPDGGFGVRKAMKAKVG